MKREILIQKKRSEEGVRKKHDNNIKNNERIVKCAFNINMITLNAKTIKKINNNKALNTM